MLVSAMDRMISKVQNLSVNNNIDKIENKC